MDTSRLSLRYLYQRLSIKGIYMTPSILKSTIPQMVRTLTKKLALRRSGATTTHTHSTSTSQAQPLMFSSIRNSSILVLYGDVASQQYTVERPSSTNFSSNSSFFLVGFSDIGFLILVSAQTCGGRRLQVYHVEDCQAFMLLLSLSYEYLHFSNGD